MLKDPIVEETRKAREELAAQFDYDPRRISEYLISNQAVSGKNYVRNEAYSTLEDSADYKKAE
jgi:hypothetical protein